MGESKPRHVVPFGGCTRHLTGLHVLACRGPDFVLAIGDDISDEDTFNMVHSMLATVPSSPHVSMLSLDSPVLPSTASPPAPLGALPPWLKVRGAIYALSASLACMDWCGECRRLLSVPCVMLLRTGGESVCYALQ